MAIAALAMTACHAPSSGPAASPERTVIVAKTRGAGREVTFAQFREAVTTYQSRLRPGGVTALMGAADAYRQYLSDFHTHLHFEFAYQFIGYLVEHPDVLPDRTLVTKLEIVLEPDGSLHGLGIVKSSGDLDYDFNAYNALYRGAPYPAPPSAVRSPDGRTYLRWSLHRGESQCGTWNAEPFILTAAAVGISQVPDHP